MPAGDVVATRRHDNVVGMNLALSRPTYCNGLNLFFAPTGSLQPPICSRRN